MRDARSIAIGRAVFAIALGAIPLIFAALPASQGAASTYTVITTGGQRVVPSRAAGATDVVPLDALASLFGFTSQEDLAARGLTLLANGQRIVLTPGQVLVSVGGRVAALSGPVIHEGQAWLVPIDFVSRALGPALNVTIEIRRASRLILVGAVRVPRVSTRLTRQGANGRLLIDVQPSAPHTITRDGSRLVIHFDADALDAAPLAAGQPDLVAGARVDGTSLAIDLGPGVASIRSDDTDPAHLAIDLLAAQSAPASPGRPGGASEPPPVVDLTPAGTLRTIVIDPGHGGDDAGARGPDGNLEKDVTLQVARRLKSAIDTRLGLRTLLTREGDDTVPIDRRTAFANNNKADLLISLHANASVRPDVRGAEVLSLSLDDYETRARALGPGVAVPVAGGGVRLIEAVPWDLAQLPYAARSAAIAGVVARDLGDQHVPLFVRAVDQAPLRILVGANMPAVLVELGFMTNADDEQALTSGDLPGQAVEALVRAVTELRSAPPASTSR